MIAALPLLLSEVLANEPGSVTSLEFVELVARHPVREGFVLLNANGDTLRIPEGPLDSGSYLVVCRDADRFEAHYGDSSGTWGDSELEAYALQELSMSLPNGEGSVSLAADQETDRFEWHGDAPDGTSYERIADSVWQPTSATIGATPGRRNAGMPANFDWSIDEIRMPPGILASGTPAVLAIEVRNSGMTASGGALTVIHRPGDTLPELYYEGNPGDLVRLKSSVLPHPGLNSVAVSLGSDDSPTNNYGEVAFYADSPPVLLSEIYPAPEPSQSEWIELFIPVEVSAAGFPLAISDGRDTSFMPAGFERSREHRYVVVAADSTLFALAHPGVLAPVVQPSTWPSLNNSGDTVELLLQGAMIDRVGYPSPGARRGVSYERVGGSAVWGWSVATSASTPGAVNSIDVPYTEGVEVSVEPNPFAAGAGERANFSYSVPFGAQADLRLFSGDGRLVRTLFERRSVVSGRASWDGNANNGRPVPVGIYILQFRLFEPREQMYLGTVVVAR